jgi:hypothetical protein
MHDKIYKKVLPLSLALVIAQATELSDAANTILTITVIIVMLVIMLTED